MIRNIFIALILLLSINTHAFAASYTVSDVKVDVEADSAMEARNSALIKARRTAFGILSNRLAASDSKARIPHATDNVIAAMVDSFEINREKLSKNRYLASVNVTFSERAVQAYLGRNTTVTIPDQAYQPQATADKTAVYSPALNQQIEHSNLYGQYKQSQQNQQILGVGDVPYRIQVNLNNIRQWVGVQRSLESIGNVAINSLNTSHAVVTLSYSGDASQLQQSLNMKGMQLYSNANNASSVAPYVLVTRG